MLADLRHRINIAGYRPAHSSSQASLHGKQPFEPPRWGFRRIVCSCLLAGLAALLVPADAFSSNDAQDLEFLDGLRQRGLARLAVRACEKELSRPDLAPATRARLTIELARSLAEQAVNSLPEDRTPLWRAAEAAIENFSEEHAENPLLFLVRLQGALLHLARGELQRQEAQLLVGGNAQLESARAELRCAISQLRELDTEVDARLRMATTSRPPGGADVLRLDAHQLASLQKTIQHELARALRNQGQSYPPDSPDRANSLTQAVELLKPLAELDATHRLAWPSRLDLIESLRLLRDYAQAGRLAAAILSSKAPQWVEQRVQAEQLLLALDQHQLAEAVRLLHSQKDPGDSATPQLDFARLKIFLAAWRSASETHDREKAALWRQRAGEQERKIEQFHGPYWSRRAEMLLAGYVRQSPEAGDVEMLVKAAESSFRSGRLEDAVSAYQRAAELAASQGNSARAFELAYIAATIEHRQNRHEEARSQYRRLALRWPNQPRAPEAHQLAIYHAGQIAKQKKPSVASAEERSALDQYAALLEEHVTTWPDAATSNDARWKLGRLRQLRGDWQHAIAAYRGISSDTPRYQEAIDAIGECTKRWLDELQSRGQPTEKSAHDAADWFIALVIGPQQEWPQSFDPADRAAVLSAAEILLDYSSDGAAQAEQILSVALRSPSKARPQWVEEAQCLLLMALAAQGRLDEAAAMLKRVGDQRVELLLETLARLQRAAGNSQPTVRRDLASLQLLAIRAIEQRDQLTKSQRHSLDRIRAQALAEAGRLDEALSEYEFLAKSLPRDPVIQESYARLLKSRNDDESLNRALEKYRQLERGSRRGSSRWFRAKYAVAELQLRQGNPEKATKIITLLKLLYPELGGPKQKRLFDELLDRARTAAGKETTP